MLTPLDLKRQQFTKQKLGGYDPEQVHAFLERVSTELEAEKEKQRAIENRAAELEKKLEHYERVELALQEALETARQTARVAQEAAEKRARVTLDEAELRAQEIVRDAERERHNLHQELSRITSRQQEVTAKMRAFLLSELEILATFEADDPAGFLRIEASGTVRQLYSGSDNENSDDENDSTMGLFEDEGGERDEEEDVGESEEEGPAGREEEEDDDSEIDWETVTRLDEGSTDGTTESTVEASEDATREEAGSEPSASEIETGHEPAVLAAEAEEVVDDAERERIRRILEDLD